MPDTTEYSANAHVSGTLSVTGSVVVNEHSHPSYDFRIESDGQSHMLFVDAGNDAIGVATDTPTEALDVIGNIRTVKNNNSAGAKGKLILAKSKGSAGSETVVSSGDTIGAIEFNAYDGNSFETAAEIYAKVDNTPGDGDMPGSLHLAVTADGAAAATDRIVIDSKGNVRVNVDAGGQTLNTSALGTIALHNGTAPGAGTTNTAVLYAISGELKTMDALGNETLLSPHPEGSEDWVFYSKNVETGKTVKIQMEKLMKKLNDLLGEDLYEEWIEEIT